MNKIAGLDFARGRLASKLKKWGATNFNPVLETWNAVAVVTFTYHKKNYIFRHPNLAVEPTKRKRKKPLSARQAFAELTWALCRMIDFDIKGIFPFQKTGKEYLQLTGQTSDNTVGFEQQNTDEIKHLQTLELTAGASNREIELKYKQLMRLYHPDRIMDENDKIEFEKKAAEVNQAFTELKKIRGIT